MASLASLAAATIFLRAVGHVVGRGHRQPDSARSFLPSSTLVPSRRTTSGTFRPTSFTAAMTPVGDGVALHDAAEDVDEDPLHLRVGGDDLERRGHLLGGGAAADVEEVRRLAAVVLDDVHGRHRQAGAVDHAADVAVELDVGEVVLLGLDLRRILLVEVAQRLQLLVAVERVVVEVDLASSASTLPSLVTTSGLISTSEPSTSIERLVQLQQEAGGVLGGVAGAARGRRPGCAPGRRASPAPGRRLLQDLLRGLGGDLLDVHAALGRGHHHHPAGAAVDQHADVELAGDVHALLDQQALDLLAARAGLVRDQVHAEDLLGRLARRPPRP